MSQSAAERGGQRAAGDEAEVARAGAGHEPGRRGRRELADHVGGVGALAGELPPQAGRIALGVDGPVAQRRQPVGGERVRGVEVVGHRR